MTQPRYVYMPDSDIVELGTVDSPMACTATKTSYSKKDSHLDHRRS